MSCARVTHLILIALIVAVPPTNAFKTFRLAGGNIHEQISKVALTAPSINLQPAALKEVDVGNTRQDEPQNISIDSHHFDSCKLDESKKFIDDCYKSIAADAATAYEDDGKRVSMLRNFGALLHPAQDFYSHSNYVELQLKENGWLTPENMPLIDWSTISNAKISPSVPSIRTGFFSALEVSGPRAIAIARLKLRGFVIKGTSYVKSGQYETYDTFAKRIEFATNPQFSFLHRDINKDNDSTEQGKFRSPVTNKLLYDYARALAERETQRQWKKFEAMVRFSAGVNADVLMEKLKKGL